MAFNGRSDKVPQDRMMLERLSQGEKPKAIAAEIGCSYSTLRRRLSRHVQAIGCQTVEQAVAQHVAEKIKREMPLALRAQVDIAVRKPAPR